MSALWSSDESLGYSTAMLAVAPLATQLAMNPITWVFIFPLFAIPALALLTSIGHLSNVGPILTYKRIAPLAAGIGWAFTWHVAESLYVEGLRAAQNVLYIIYSLRFRLDWATDCEHSYNSKHCVPFETDNATIADFDSYRYPANFWPAEEFNCYRIRGNPIPTNLTVWEPNEWYIGAPDQQFYFDIPSLSLMIAHTFVWSAIYFILLKRWHNMNTILPQVFIMLPTLLYVVLMMGMMVSGFHFKSGSIEADISQEKREKNPNDFWADVRGLYRTSLVMVDYSGAFTGLILFATSRLRQGSASLNALLMVPCLMIVPMIMTILRTGCEGHVSDLQSHYKIYASTDETISYDLLPVCFATSTLGPLWSLLYFTAQFLYTSLGPMIVYVWFIFHAFAEEFPTVHNYPQLFFAAIVAAFAAPSVLLYMPMGTKIITMFRYVSQNSIIQILAYITIYLVYGWQSVEADVLATTSNTGQPSVMQYLTRSTSPIFTGLLLTLIPALLFSKFAAVFDLLVNGNDMVMHIDAGASFIVGPQWLRRMVGSAIMFAPTLIVISFALGVVFNMVVKHKLRFTETLKATSEWMQHAAVNTNRPRPHSLIYGLFNSVFNVSYQTLIFCLFIMEIFVGFVLICIFAINAFKGIGPSTAVANDYRSLMLFIFVILHFYGLLLMRKCQLSWDTPDRLNLSIAMIVLETAMLNGYMWMFASDLAGTFDWSPFFVIFFNTFIRGSCLACAVAIRAHLRDVERPTRTRDATEIYEPDTGLDIDPEDESPIIFDLARA